ncbi:hypothetical protein ABN702_19045 [Bacillus haimaensis]|uniref:hypothetical protein n=1 Tax=Bacillus haimaensis TaxID=3160967 RepID=UPI003AA97ED0
MIIVSTWFFLGVATIGYMKWKALKLDVRKITVISLVSSLVLCYGFLYQLGANLTNMEKSMMSPAVPVMVVIAGVYFSFVILFWFMKKRLDEWFAGFLALAAFVYFVGLVAVVSVIGS